MAGGVACVLFRRGAPGDLERARTLLDWALAPAADLGLRRIERRVGRLLAEVGS